MRVQAAAGGIFYLMRRRSFMRPVGVGVLDDPHDTRKRIVQPFVGADDSVRPRCDYTKPVAFNRVGVGVPDDPHDMSQTGIVAAFAGADGSVGPAFMSKSIPGYTARRTVYSRYNALLRYGGVGGNIL